jgi:hypothetical protein
MGLRPEKEKNRKRLAKANCWNEDTFCKTHPRWGQRAYKRAETVRNFAGWVPLPGGLQTAGLLAGRRSTLRLNPAKTARLPKAVRDELNRRLENGQPGKQLVTWLNGLPEVQAVLAADFGGKPVREQNLSEWKQGGYRDWVTQQEALELAARLGEDAAELSAADRPPLTDTLALWLAARYAVATRR